MEKIYRFLLTYKFADVVRENLFHKKIHELYVTTIEIKPFSYIIEIPKSASAIYEELADLITQDDYLCVCALTHNCKATDPKILDFAYHGKSK